MLVYSCLLNACHHVYIKLVCIHYACMISACMLYICTHYAYMICAHPILCMRTHIFMIVLTQQLMPLLLMPAVVGELHVYIPCIHDMHAAHITYAYSYIYDCADAAHVVVAAYLY